MSPSQSTPSSQNKINKLFNRNNNNKHRSPPSSYDPPAESSSSQPLATDTSTRSITKKLSKARLRNSNSPLPIERADSSGSDVLAETPVIVEPMPIPARSEQPPQRRQSTSVGVGRRSMNVERPATMAHHDPATMMMAQSSPSSNRFADIPNRLSGWFTTAFPTGSSADVSQYASLIPSLTSSATIVPSSSPPRQKTIGGFLGAAKHPARGLGGGIEKAVRYFLDTDAQPDMSTEAIWLMGVMHPGYEPPSPSPYLTPTQHTHRRESTEAPSHHARRSTPPTLSRGSGVVLHHTNASLQSLNTSLTASPNSSKGKDVISWPPAFYEDYTSCVWMTYRSQYIGIRDITLAALEAHATADADPHKHGQGPEMVASPPRKWWPPLGERTWTSDAGWGCMLRTGQSLLATALIRLHLSRDWRRPSVPSLTSEYATYVKILTWFLDSPSTLCPFSVHRMALAGKDLGKDVGSWFGPSTAAGAIKTLVHAFPDSQMAVSLASDAVVFESDVHAASRLNEPLGASGSNSKWGGRAVLVLIGIRLGIDGVNPVYYNSIKEIFTWPQSVGISGGRPSSSYYFVGEQAGSLFYLDPHHTRPTVPLRQPPPADSVPVTTPSSPATTTSQLESDEGGSGSRRASTSPSHGTPPSDRDLLDRSFGAKLSRMASSGGGSIKGAKHRRGTAPGSPGNNRVRSGSSSQQQHPSHSPSPLHQHGNTAATTPSNFTYVMAGVPGSSPSDGSSFNSVVPPPTHGNMVSVDAQTYHYCTAYSQHELRTFHCDKVRKMSLPALDPSMLLGFLVKDEEEWIDLRRRHAALPKAIFTIQDEPPSWTTDPTDADLESLSDHDLEEEPSELEESVKPDQGSDDFYDAEDGDQEREPRTSTQRRASNSPSVETCGTGSDDAEAHRRSSTLTSSSNKGSSRDATTTDESLNSVAGDDDDDDWDSSIPSSSPPPAVVYSSVGTLDKTHAKSKSLGTPASVREASPTPSRASMSVAQPVVLTASPDVNVATQYPFPSGRTSSPSPEPPQGPSARTGQRNTTAKLSKRRASLKGKDGGRTPSGGVLAIFNPGKGSPAVGR
ncbi:Cysteine protease atg4 [Tulasnella sp. 330]|nr:Cysteine protease atg4 [Tulasnella sp. 330]KAG8880669.1 Cysteine protease atg4 [Tulasnella sp. 331]KAG8888200.1 Cysteine protease atg4 [Tulasnella sp. 332]